MDTDSQSQSTKAKHEHSTQWHDLTEATYGASLRVILDQAIPNTATPLRVAEIASGGHCTLSAAAYLLSSSTPVAVTYVVEATKEWQHRARECLAGLTQRHNTVTVVEGCPYDTKLPREEFDVVYTALTLGRLAQPEKTVAEMLALVKPGGVVLLVDADLEGLDTAPTTPSFQSARDILRSHSRAHGADYRMGRRLHSLLYESGAVREAVKLHLIHPVSVGGSAEAHLWEHYLLDVASDITATGVASRDDVEAVVTEMAAATAQGKFAVLHPPLFVASAVKH